MRLFRSGSTFITPNATCPNSSLCSEEVSFPILSIPGLPCYINTRSSLTYTQGVSTNECLLRILQDLERHQTGQVLLSFFGHMSSWMAWLRWALAFGNLGSLWKPWPLYFHVLPIYYVHWCSLMFLDVHWCSLMFIDVHWCSLLFFVFLHSNILNQRHVSMKSYGPMGMLGSAPPWSMKKVHSSSPPPKKWCGTWVFPGIDDIYILYVPIVPALQWFFFLIIFIDDLGLQKFTIKPQRHGSFSRDLIADRSEDDWEVPWPAAATEITWFARRTQHISGRGTGIFFPRCRDVSYL